MAEEKNRDTASVDKQLAERIEQLQKKRQKNGENEVEQPMETGENEPIEKLEENELEQATKIDDATEEPPEIRESKESVEKVLAQTQKLTMEQRLGNPSPFGLAIKLGGEPLDELVFDEDCITIGRGSECNVVIDNLGASRIHAQIERLGRFFVLRDLDSKTGTFVRGNKIDEYCLNTGDEIFLAKHTLVFRKLHSTRWHKEEEDKGAKESKVNRQELMQTIAVDFRNMAQKQGPAPAHLYFLDVNRKIPVTKNAFFFGKASFCDFTVNGFLIGERHALLVNDQKGFILYHLGLWKAPKVNGKPVNMAHLKESDLIEIGDVRFVFKAAQEA